MISVKLTPTIVNEYSTRCPEWLPDEVDLKIGINKIPESLAKDMLEDAKYNSDLTVFSVGPYDMPLPVYNAYRALARQLSATLE
jgi:hypothetical protein